MQSLSIPTDTARYARCIEASKRVRWDIDRDVIRGRGFDLRQKFLPDGLSLIDELAFLDTKVDRLQRVRAIRIGLLGRQNFDRRRRVGGPDARSSRLGKFHGRTLMSLTNSVV